MARLLTVLLLILPASVLAQEPIVVVDGQGKEHTLHQWKFTQGTRFLSWLAPADTAVPPSAPKGKGKAPALAAIGPEALEVREGQVFTYQDGITTLMPLTSVKAIEFDSAKKNVSVTVLDETGKEQTLTGTTKYLNLNRFAVEGQSKGDKGGNLVKFKGGDAKDTLKAIRFPGAKATLAPAQGSTITVQAPVKEEMKHRLTAPRPLYQVGSRLQVQPNLFFQISVQVPLEKVSRLRYVPAEDSKIVSKTFEVSLAEKEVYLLTLREPMPEGNSAGKWVGIIGRTAVGYKWVPPHMIADLTFEK